MSEKEYDFVSKIYDPLLFVFLYPIRKKLIQELKSFQDKKILDLCCGTGDQLKRMAKKGFENLHGLDISEAMLKLARKKPDPNIHFYQEDAGNTRFEAESFDTIMISFAIHEKEREVQEKMLFEAERVLKKDGLLVIVDYQMEQKTNGVAKKLIGLIEWIAGKTHYANYKNYVKNKGLDSLIQTERFVLQKKLSYGLGSVGIFFYKKNQS